MSSIVHSREARAAQRFVEATRNVELAFRAVRGSTDHDSPASQVEHATAQSQLDRALDELALAQAQFDAAVNFHTRKRQ